MCGMKVVVVKSAPNGDIDLEDFADKAAKAGDKLAAVMILSQHPWRVRGHRARGLPHRP